MEWHTTKIPSKDTQKLEFINKAKEKAKEDELAYHTRMFLENFEGFKPKAYYDSEGIPTIGFGFNLTESSVYEAVKTYLTPKPIVKYENFKQTLVDLKDIFDNKFQKLENGKKYKLQKSDFSCRDWNIIKSIQDQENNSSTTSEPKTLEFPKEKLQKCKNALLQDRFPFTITIEDSRKVSASLIDERRNRLEKRYEKFDSYEHLALLSIFYNSESLIKKDSKTDKAIKNKDRFKVWFEIRYNSNGGKDIGIAKRRFAESNVFGLFENTKRGEYKNTANWNTTNGNTANEENNQGVDLNETMKFFSSLHSKFKENKSYFEYVKHYEEKQVFGQTTIPGRIKWEKDNTMLDFELHYKSYTEVFSPFVKTFNMAMQNAGCQANFDLEGILVVNESNRQDIVKTINEKSQDKELAIILDKGAGLGFSLYQNRKIQNHETLHIIFSLDNYIDCFGFEYPQRLAFYAIENNQITKLRGCTLPLIHQSISVGNTTMSGLIQRDTNERHIHCFKSLPNGRYSPNLLICKKNDSEPLATIFNLCCEGIDHA